MLCEKVNKKEIRIRFFETDHEGNQQWEAFGNFNESDVHHQVAIVFRTPPYRDQNVSKPVQVYLQLYRQRDGEFSEARTFIYKPKNVHDSNGEYGSDSLSAKSGLQECVLTRIKMENQPPGYKRRKYSHQQGTSHYKMGKSGNNRNHNTSSDTLTNNSYLHRKNGTNRQRMAATKIINQQQQQQQTVVIKTENDELSPLVANNSNSNGSSNTSGNNNVSASNSTTTNNNSSSPTTTTTTNNGSNYSVQMDSSTFCHGKCLCVCHL